MNREIETAKIRNGNIIIGHSDIPALGEIIVVRHVFWIRSRTYEPNILESIVKCEDKSLKPYRFPLVDILEGQHGAISFDGVFHPKELKSRLQEIGLYINPIDPREAIRNSRRLRQEADRLREAYRR